MHAGLSSRIAEHLQTTTTPRSVDEEVYALLVKAIRVAEDVESDAAPPDLCDGSPVDMAPRPLVDAVRRAERTALALLAPDSRLGVESPDWADVMAVVHDAAFAIVGACAERVAGRQDNPRDALTSLIVRPVFDLALAQETGRARRYQQPLSLILFEVDNLDEIEATLGASVRDRVIERMGILVRRFFRTHDWVARHGGRSIAVLLPQTSLDDATDLAYHVRSIVEQRLVPIDHEKGGGVPLRLNAAAVGTELVEPALDPYFIVATAEDAIRRIRATGRSRVERVELRSSAVTTDAG
jgi:diguanylate cyclase (GGDEF)-like protein